MASRVSSSSPTGTAAGRGAFVRSSAAGVHDDEAFGRREDRVQEQLAVLGGGVALADAGVAGQDVVAVGAPRAGEHLVVEPEQAHDAVRDAAHRQQRGDGERAGAEVRAGGPAGEVVAQDRADVVQRERGTLRPRIVGGAADLGEHGAGLRELPDVGGGGGGEPVDGEGERVEPRAQGPGALHAVEHLPDTVDELGEPAHQIGVAGVDLVERQRGVEPDLLVPGHGDADQQAVQPPLPRVVRHAAEPVGGPVLLVEPPAHAGAGHERAEPLEVVVVEPEAAPDGLRLREVEQLARREPGVREVEHGAEDAEERVHLRERAVGEPDLEPVAGVLAVARAAERRGDQRGEGLDVGAHDDDVARLERRVVREEAEHRLAQHLHLPVRAVAGVDGHAGVARDVGEDGRAVVAQVVLQALQQRRRRVLGRGVVDVRDAGPRRGEAQLQLTGIAREGAQQRVGGDAGRRVRRATPADAHPGGAAHRVPQRGRGVRQPEVDLAGAREGLEDLQVGGGQPGGPEEGEPRREVPVAAAEPGAVLRERLRRPGDGHRLAQTPPQLGLPAQVGRDLAPRAVLVLLRGPGPQHRRPVLAVGVEEPREVAGRGEPPTRAGAGRVAHHAEVGAQRRAPRLARAGVDHLEQRPDEALGPPRVVLGVAPRPGHQLGGRGELHPGTHPVVPEGRAEAVGEALREPALHPAGRHGDHVGGEGVRRRRREHVGQRLGQPVRALGAVHVEGHPAPPSRSPSLRPAR